MFTIIAAPSCMSAVHPAQPHVTIGVAAAPRKTRLALIRRIIRNNRTRLDRRPVISEIAGFPAAF
jgi:hypothetical protein